MRLTHIKIAGFKSFVDPTTLVLPENMTCIVGPNGCGKSNTIDAVRWVMGESSAKHLRGDQKTDVIFAGSTARKPVSQASVELLFDNQDNRILGEYAQYAEIAVKRVVTRDGNSQYFLNNTKCRRRDVTALFLGTGLGPRSYAIIEQGMISNLITAKPEELRTFLEEAAGISKYKERRRETEQRMTRTRENLERLFDIREELARQIRRLEKQAADANIYTTLQAQKRQMQAELTCLKLVKVQELKSQLDTKVHAQEQSLQDAYTQRRAADQAIDESKVTLDDAQESFYKKQQHYYQVGTAITKLEEAQKHQALRRSGLEADIAQAKSALQLLQEHKGEDEARREALQTQLDEHEPELEILEDRIDAGQERFDTAQETFNQWQADWQEYTKGSAAPREISQVEQASIIQYEKAMERWVAKKDGLQQELALLKESQELSAMESKRAQLNIVTDQIDAAAEMVAEKRAGLVEAQEQLHTQQQEQQQLRAQLDQAQGRFDSLQEVHEKALHTDDEHQSQWLESQVASDTRLAQCLEVEPRWQKAVEIALGPLLTGIVTDHLKEHWLNEPCPQRTFLLGTAKKKQEKHSARQSLFDVLQLKHPICLPGWLEHVFLAEPQEAHDLVNQLERHESVLTPQGQWLGAGWACYGLTDSQPGLLVLQHDLETLRATLEQTTKALEDLEQQVSQQQVQVERLRDEIANVQDREKRLEHERSDISSLLSGLEAKAEQVGLRQERLQADIRDCDQNIESDWRALQESRKKLEVAVESMATFEARRLELEGQQEGLQQDLHMCRDALTQDQDRARELSETLKFASASLEALQLQEQRSQLTQQQHQDRLQELARSLEASQQDVNLQELPSLLQAQQEAQQIQTKAKELLEQVQQQMRAQEKQKSEAEKAIDQWRTKLEALRIQVQAQQSQLDHLEQQLAQQNGNFDEVLLAMPAQANEHTWAKEIESLERQVAALGAINLAAIEEFDAQSERKNYMDEQYSDLETALFTLETAIEQIDAETRDRFQVTFSQINEGMGQLFPRLFGGGQAKLELVGDDILTAGVAIMARPPGKKNTSIHMLSGGEKALTAISLVFAIFQLNPSPFCMLDEVDAPLDDANVGRYADMVKHMSEKVQFIYISHNKIAMEKASQLMGVTMQEPGVSRLVSVDIGEASALAAM